MLQRFRFIPLLAFLALPATARDWSLGVATGPFVFGDFVERTAVLSTETGSARTTETLSAGTRVGVAVDLERTLTHRLGIRFGGTFTRAPLSVENEGEGIELDAGEMDVTTWTVPLVFRINRDGAFRFYLFGGPAYAIYNLELGDAETLTSPVFDGTRGRWGIVGGGGVAWHMSEQFAVAGEISDVTTSSPFEREDFSPTATGLDIPRTHNIHTTVGIRWTF